MKKICCVCPEKEKKNAFPFFAPAPRYVDFSDCEAAFLPFKKGKVSRGGLSRLKKRVGEDGLFALLCAEIGRHGSFEGLADRYVSPARGELLFSLLDEILAAEARRSGLGFPLKELVLALSPPECETVIPRLADRARLFTIVSPVPIGDERLEGFYKTLGVAVRQSPKLPQRGGSALALILDGSAPGILRACSLPVLDLRENPEGGRNAVSCDTIAFAAPPRFKELARLWGGRPGIDFIGLLKELEPFDVKIQSLRAQPDQVYFFT